MALVKGKKKGTNSNVCAYIGVLTKTVSSREKEEFRPKPFHNQPSSLQAEGVIS